MALKFVVKVNVARVVRMAWIQWVSDVVKDEDMHSICFVWVGGGGDVLGVE